MSAANNEPVVGVPLREALLRGERIVASKFAEALGISRQGVTDALRRLAKRGLVQCEKVKQEGRGGALMVWTCIDMAGMRAHQPKMTNRPERTETPTPNLSLVEAWGMRVVDIPLPTYRHEIWVRDEMEAA